MWGLTWCHNGSQKDFLLIYIPISIVWAYPSYHILASDHKTKNFFGRFENSKWNFYLKDNQGITRKPSMFIWAKVPSTVFVQEFPTPTWVEGGEGWSPHAGRCPQIYCRKRTSAEAVLWLGHRAEETLEQLPASFLLAFPQWMDFSIFDWKFIKVPGRSSISNLISNKWKSILLFKTPGTGDFISANDFPQNLAHKISSIFTPTSHI